MFEPIGKILPNSLRKSGALARIKASQIVFHAQKTIDDIFGERAAAMRVTAFRAGTLNVTCRRSVYAQDIALREQEIIERLNARLGSPEIRRIRSAC